MGNGNYGPLRVLTKNKMQIVSLDPKDIAVDGRCVYAYPRNKSFEESEHISRTLLGEYRDGLYAQQAMLQLFHAITLEKSSFTMPEEHTLESYILNAREKNMAGIDDAIVEEELYSESVISNFADGDIFSVSGKMKIEDAGVYIMVEMHASMGDEAHYSFYVCDKDGFSIENYENVTNPHEYCISRYNVFMRKMQMVAERKRAEYHQK